MKDGVNPLRPSNIECNGPCGERHYDEFALAGRSAIVVAVVGLQRGSRHRSGVGLITGSTARVRHTSASALTTTMFLAIGVGFRQRAVRTVTVTKTVLLLQASARGHEQLAQPSHEQVWVVLKK